MKKHLKKKLSLNRETLRALQEERLQEAAGGATVGGSGPKTCATSDACTNCSTCSGGLICL